MTLEYNILWIDDQPDSIETKKDDVKEYLQEEKGFDCNIQAFKSYREYIDNHGADGLNDFDLLIVDYTLDDIDDKYNHSGFDIIKDIRENKIYKEVIFYSSNYDHLIHTIKNDYVEGIFTAPRAELSDKVQDIIDVLIKKVQDVNNLRGLIMAEVAELDMIKEAIILKASSKISEKSLERYALKKIKGSGETSTKQAQGHIDNISNVTFNLLFGKIGFVDSNKKAMTIGEALSKLDITEPVTKETFTQPYIDNILSKRNMFAHIKECDGYDENGKSCKVIGHIPFTEEKCIEIRKEIKEYKNILEQINQQIG